MASVKQMREMAVKYMTSRKKKNTYTNGSDRKYFFGKPDNKVGNTDQKGYSDCSAAVRAAIKAASGIDIGYNTNEQIKNQARGIIVDLAGNGKYYPDESKLLPGDALYFKGNTAHVEDVGHVEMYVGNGKCWGHGSGIGPNEHTISSYCKGRASSKKKYYKAIRWIHTEGEKGMIDDQTEYPLGGRLLLQGCVGNDVKELQLHLKMLGYFKGDLGGNFLELTKRAVLTFQSANKLDVDGEYGPLTHAALMSALNATDMDSEAESKDSPKGIGIALISDGSCWVRSMPSKSGSKITSVGNNSKWKCIAKADNGWLCIVCGDRSGWVSGVFATLQEGK